jgi:hypothetical protein
MKLSTVTNKDNIELRESEKPALSADDIITRPLGIKEDEWTPDYIEHLRHIREHSPKLYHKIQHGL